MKDSTTSELSNLFQELIVSKIKDEIELLKKEIDDVKESNETCEEKVEKLPKSSSIKQIVEGEQTKVINLINKIAKDSKSEKYLRDIVAYLKKQYAFSDERTLCLVLDEIQQKNNMVFDEITLIKSFVETNNIEDNLNSLINYIMKQCSFDDDKSLCYFLEQFSDATKERIATIIANQESFAEKYDSIVAVLGQYKDSILALINENIKSSECIIEQLNFIQEALDSISQKTDDATIMLNRVMDNIGSESDWSIKKNFLDINKKIEELLRKIELQDEMIRAFDEKYKCLEKSKNNMVKIIVVGDFISVIGVIALILMQIF